MTIGLIDRDMRETIHTFLHHTVMRQPGSMRIDEYCFRVRHVEGRCDIVVVNDLLHCYEIKSDADKHGVERLKTRQIELYGSIMDRLSVITTPKYLPAVRRTLPEFWGIYSYVDHVVAEERAPSAHEQLTSRAIAGLLWKENAMQLLADSGLERGLSRKAKGFLHDFIADSIDYPLIHEAVRRQLKSHRRSF